MRKAISKFAALAAFFIVLGVDHSSAQCIVINEIMVNPGISCDGTCSPSTAEWTELYNNCPTPVDISCYKFTDGDFSFTIPSGTIIPPFGHFVIGSTNSNVSVDLDLGTCNCTSGGLQVGIFTNGNEQLIMYNSAGVFSSGIYWGTGQFPVSYTIPASGSCTGMTAVVANATALPLELIGPNGGTDGCTYARSCDGASDWITDCTGGTPNATNGQLTPPSITPGGPISLCPGNTSELSISGTFDSYQWYDANGPIAGETTNSLVVNSTGDYSIQVSLGLCTVFSTPVHVAFDATISVDITPAGTSNACDGEFITLSATPGFNYQWYQDGVAIGGATSETYDANTSGVFTVEANQDGCTDISNASTVSIEAPVEVLITASSATTFCEGQSTTLSASTVFQNYQWYDGSLAMSGETGATLNVSESGDYHLVASNSGCDGTSNSIDVVVIANPIITLTPAGPSVICEGSTLTLTCTAGYDHYDWTLDGGPASGSSNSIVADIAGVYGVTAYTAEGCFSPEITTTLTVAAYPDLVISSSTGSFTFCADDVATLSTTNGFTDYTWLIDGTLSDGPNANSASTFSTSGTYTVNAISAEGCIITGVPQNIIVNPMVQPSISPNGPLSICETSAVLTANGGLNNYTWTLDGAPISGGLSGTLIINQAGLYQVEIINATCGLPSVGVDANFFTAVVANIIASDTIVCPDAFATLSLDQSFVQTEWSTGSTDTSINAGLAGTYSVQTTDIHGCTSQDSIVISVFVTDIINAGPDMDSDCDLGAVLAGTAGGNFYWSPSTSLSDPLALNPIASPTQTTTYTLTSIQHGCSISDEMVVSVDCTSLFIPSCITPNEDGVNDYFQAIGRGIRKFEITIFDRWGQPVYHSTDMNGIWDGSVNGDGYYISDGVYNYIVIAEDFKGQPILSDLATHGFVTVLR